ncbi:MAG: hypothetical protein WCA20_36695 [Candidatus Sulfotelmatobacter sp.]
MKAICVTDKPELELRDFPTPADPPDGHLLVQIEACAINHGDKAFLARPAAAAGLNTSTQNIWGASGSGRVLSAGPGVPAGYPGRTVALYRSSHRAHTRSASGLN